MNSLRNKLLLISCLLMSGFVCGMNPQEPDITQQVAPGGYGHEECPICCDNYREFVYGQFSIIFPCGHWVCSTCCPHVNRCPLCRQLLGVITTMNKDTMLYQAILESNVYMIRTLIANGANVNTVTTNSGNSLLHEAAGRGNGEVVKMLIESGADINGRNWFRETPLSVAVDADSMETINVLLEKGAYTNARDNEDHTPLHHAAMCGYVNAAIALLEAGADVHAVNQCGETALHCALSRSGAKLVPILLAYDADVNAVSRFGHTPLSLAKMREEIKVLKMLRDEGAKNKCIIQ